MSVNKKGTYKKITITMLLSGTVAAGDVVMLDLAAAAQARFETCKKCAAVATIGNPSACGVALQAGVAGDYISVQVGGYHPAVASSGVAQNDPLCVIGTAGTAVPLVAAGTTPALGMALSATSGGTCEANLFNPHRLGI